MVDYNGVIYTYAQNYQGDILGLLDSTGAAVVTYSYDAWGRLLATGGTLASTLGKLNPFRYRGYVYDEETGLYYLRSRYYNPEWGRFISSDALLGKVGAVGTHNLFAYCGNEPVNHYDSDGRFPIAIGTIFAWVATYGGAILKAAIPSILTGMTVDWLITERPFSTTTSGSVTLSAASSAPPQRVHEASEASIDKYKLEIEAATFYLAGSFGGKLLWDTSTPLSLSDTLIMLGVTGAANLADVYSKLPLQAKFPKSDPYVQDFLIGVDPDRDDGIIWGVYTESQAAAEGLSFMFGMTKERELSNTLKAYYHYHDSGHVLHMWFGTYF